VTNPVLSTMLQAVFWTGWGLLFVSSFLINHFELFGLRQVFARLMGRELPSPVFNTPLLYATFAIRSTSASARVLVDPNMTVGHLVLHSERPCTS